MLRKYFNKANLHTMRNVTVIIVAVFGSFWLTSLVLQVAIWILLRFNVPIGSVNQNILNSVLAFVAYAVTIVIFVFVLRQLKIRLSSAERGMSRMPVWSDLLLAPLGFILYMLLSVVLMFLAGLLIPGFDINKAQDVGFSNLSGPYEALAAFIALVILAPIAEEILFRGYLFGALKKYLRSWQVILITAIIFAFMHGSLNVGVDTFALGIMLATLRASSGSIWPSILLHMMKNSLAFYLIFINPALLHTISG